MSKPALIFNMLLLAFGLCYMFFEIINRENRLNEHKALVKEYHQKLITDCQKDHKLYECESMLKGLIEQKLKEGK